jgi:hypothetical protein
MIVPNKVIRFDESIIGKIPYILNEIENKDISVQNLYDLTRDKFDGVDQFILAIDTLYILDAIYIDFKKGVISYVNRG